MNTDATIKLSIEPYYGNGLGTGNTTDVISFKVVDIVGSIWFMGTYLACEEYIKTYKREQTK